MKTRAASSGAAAGAAGVTFPAGSAASGLAARLSPGQVVRGHVAGQGPDGTVQLELMGESVDAFSEVPLENGYGYEFTVLAVRPRILLSRARPAALPLLPAAVDTGRLGVGGAHLTAALGDLLQGLSSPRPRTSDERPDPELRWLGEVDAMTRRLPDADELREFHDRLGHDQEARVLDLPALGVQHREAEHTALRNTAKALALRAPGRLGSNAMVTLLDRWLADNARRAAGRAPLVLPLPAGADSAVRDARLLVDHGASEDAPVTLVLLVEMRNLGAIRVDLSLRDNELTARVLAETTATLDHLRSGVASLGARLEEAGLHLADATFRQVGPRGIPVADLIGPPAPEDTGARLDVRA